MTGRTENTDLAALLVRYGLTEEDVARHLKLSVGTVHGWCATKQVPRGITGEIWRISQGKPVSRELGG